MVDSCCNFGKLCEKAGALQMTSQQYTNNQRLRQELTVFGYIKEHYNTNSELIFPTELIQICVSFYLLIKDKFLIDKTKMYEDNIKEGSVINLSIQNLNDIIECINETEYTQFNIIKGSMVVVKGNIQIWRIKLIESNLDINKRIIVAFGIACVNDQRSRKWGIRQDGKLIHCSDGTTKYKDYVEQLDINQDIEVILDMKSNENNGIVRYVLNGEEKGIAYDTLDTDKEYGFTFCFVSYPNSRVVFQVSN